MIFFLMLLFQPTVLMLCPQGFYSFISNFVGNYEALCLILVNTWARLLSEGVMSICTTISIVLLIELRKQCFGSKASFLSSKSKNRINDMAFCLVQLLGLIFHHKASEVEAFRAAHPLYIHKLEEKNTWRVQSDLVFHKTLLDIQLRRKNKARLGFLWSDLIGLITQPRSDG